MFYEKEKLDACLARMNYKKPITLTKECLDDLIFTCQCNISYDNLDVFDYKKEVFIDPESLYRKIVIDHRGGYCFELNGFFYWVLKSLGFDVVPCACRVMFGADKPEDNFIDHRASIVTLDGKRYLCDVGMGAPMPLAALLIEENLWQDTRGELFCVRKCEQSNWYTVWRKVPSKDGIDEHRDFYFLDAPMQEMDFQVFNYYVCHQKGVLPDVRRMVSRRTPDGYLDITNDVYTEVANGVKTERKLSYEELLPFIRETFDINITEPLREI